MTKLITIAALFAAAVCAQATQKKSDKTATTAPAPAPAAASPVPKDAVKNADGTWSYTDKQGKKWVYVTTPFGVMRTDVTETASQAAPAPQAGAKIIDKGDSVRFEMPGPFGVTAWEKKKSELNDQERQMIEAQQTQTAKPEAK
jgi:hypothetical protein